MPSPASDEAAASATVAAAAVAEGMAVAARVEEATGGDGSAAVLGGVMLPACKEELRRGLYRVCVCGGV